MPKIKSKKYKVNDPTKMISFLSVLIDALLLSYLASLSFILVLISLIIVYVSLYMFFEKRKNSKLDADYDDDDDYYDGELEDYYEKPQVKNTYKSYKTKPEKGDFTIVKSAYFRDTDEDYDELEEDNSWRSMYNKHVPDSNHSGFDEEYKKYFSTALPGRDEVTKPQKKVQSKEHTRPNYRDDDYISSNNVIELNPSSAESSSQDSSEDSEEEEEHILDIEDIETEANEIKTKVDDLIQESEYDHAMADRSVTSKLKLFRKSKSNIVEEFEDNDTISPNMNLIDELYADRYVNKFTNFNEEHDFSEEYSEELECSETEENLEEDIKENYIEENINESNDSIFEETPIVEDSIEEEPTAVSEKIQDIEDLSQTLIDIMSSMDINAVLKNICKGNSITIYEFKLSSISLINKLKLSTNKIEEKLGISGIRIIDVIQNKSIVGVEIPNETFEEVYFEDIASDKQFKLSNVSTSCILGKDVYGNVVFSDIQKLTHLLVVGSREEKDICMHTFIASIISKVKTFDVDFVMIDTNQENFNKYDGIPNLFVPVVLYADDALSELNGILNFVNTRHELFARQDVSNITDYNYSRPKNQLSQMIVFINELSDLMLHDYKRTEELLSNLLQKSRSAGVFLVIGTSFGSEDVLTGLIKANIPSKIVFKLESEKDSEYIIDIKGAEKLLGNSDMLYCPKGCLNPQRVQGAYISDEDIQRLVNSIL